jgi:hypothetical protein
MFEFVVVVTAAAVVMAVVVVVIINLFHCVIESSGNIRVELK